MSFTPQFACSFENGLAAWTSVGGSFVIPGGRYGQGCFVRVFGLEKDGLMCNAAGVAVEWTNGFSGNTILSLTGTNVAFGLIAVGDGRMKLQVTGPVVGFTELIPQFVFTQGGDYYYLEVLSNIDVVVTPVDGTHSDLAVTVHVNVYINGHLIYTASPTATLLNLLNSLLPAYTPSLTYGTLNIGNLCNLTVDDVYANDVVLGDVEILSDDATAVSNASNPEATQDVLEFAATTPAALVDVTQAVLEYADHAVNEVDMTQAVLEVAYVPAVPGALALACPVINSVMLGGFYSQSLVATGGTDPYTFAIIAGSLPTALTLDGPSGLISGIAGATGTFDYTAQVTDSLGAIATIDCSIIVLPPLAITCPVQSGVAVVGVVFTSNAPGVISGTPPYSFALISGPDWMSIDPLTGIVTGTPTEAGPFTFVIQVTDSLAATANTNPGCTGMVRLPAGIARGMSILTAKQFSELREKALLGMPTDIYLDHEFPNAGFHLWPIPSRAHDIEFFYWALLQQFETPDEALDLPEGYRDALVFNLAIALCQSYRRPVPGPVLALAQNAKKMLQEINAQILTGSYHSARTLSGPNEGEIKPAALGPPQPTLLPGAKE